MRCVEWRYLAFDTLCTAELYAVLQLRSEIFVIEQACIFEDMDGAGSRAIHLLGTVNGTLVAYARCFTAGDRSADASIGRILTHSSIRGSGVGHELVRKAISCLSPPSRVQRIRLAAQSRLQGFYRQHGFEISGRPYLEDGIPHIEMLRSA